MKRKHVIATFALSALMGIGVFAGVRANKVKEANAATLPAATEVYLTKTNSISADFFNYGITAIWNHGNNKFDVFAYDTVSGYYKATLSAATESFNLFRGESASWDKKWDQSENKSFETGKNLITVNTWKDGKIDFTWDSYTPTVSYNVDVYVDGKKRGTEEIGEGNLPAEPAAQFGKTFSGWFDDADCSEGHQVTGVTSNAPLYGKMLEAGTVTFALDTSKVSTTFTGTLNLYAWDANGNKNAEWPGVAIADATKVKIYNNVSVIINNGTVQTVDITTLKDNDTLRIKNSTDEKDHYYVEWMSDVDEPTQGNGYYIVGTETSWKFAGATKMALPELEENDAELLNYTGKVGEKLKVRYYNGDTGEDIYGFCKSGELAGIGEVDEKENFVFTAAVPVDIFAKWEEASENNWQINFYVTAHADRYVVTIHDVLFEGAAKVGVAEQTHTQRATAGVDFEYNLPDMNGYVARALYTDANCTTLYEKHALTGNTDLYAKYTKLGNYMTGDATYAGSEALAWNIDGASYLTSDVNDPLNRLEGTVVIPASADEEHPVAVKALQFTGIDEEGKTIWAATTYKLGADYKFVELDKDSNFVFKKGGTFSVYINQENEVYFNEGAAAFYTKFITDMNHVCDADGNTNTEALAAKWLEEKAAYDSLSAEEKAAIVAVGIEHGDPSGDDLHKVVASYEYIVKKYGTSVVEDFIWNGTYAPEANYNTIGMTADDTTMTVVVISAIAVISAAGLFFLIRRKRRLVK